MKEKYTKPVLRMEMFTLTQNIAQTCGSFEGSTVGRPTSGDSNSCGWDMGNAIVWVEAPACTMPWPADGEFAGVCLHNPNGGVTVFGS